MIARPAVLSVFAAAVVSTAALPEWTAKIRADHPRLFLNADTWPGVKARALAEEKEWYERTKRRVDAVFAKPRPDTARDLGPDTARAAFVFLVSGDAKYLDHARAGMAESLDMYEQKLADRKPVNWYSTSRVHFVLAWDWLYNDLGEEERTALMTRFVKTLDGVLKIRPRIHRENYSGYNTGFYGVRNTCWFVGCTVHGTGIEPALVDEWLVWGQRENEKLLEHRRKACGDDGGGASPTLGYIFGAYPWSEQNYLYTWLSATGENMAPDWPHAAWLANYVYWNWIPAKEFPREFGYGDTPHTDNRLPTWQLYTHMANIRHLYGEKAPAAAALAKLVQDSLPERHQRHSDTWFIYPFLLTKANVAPAASLPPRTPFARDMANMGQVFLRSGTGPDDTYCLFSCGGVLNQHRHFDALNFVVYHRGYLALDSGTRYKEFDNGEHLANYYAQTVAHNCVVIHQPDEPVARYWGGEVTQIHGGQHKQLGSVLQGFETNDRFSYVAGDATACYQHSGKTQDGKNALPQKATLVTRQIVFLMPNRFVVFDRVAATSPDYRKDWLLHTANEPVLGDHEFRADHEQGRLFCRTLLPEDAALRKIGGEGKEFWASGRNWDIVKGNLKPEQLAMMGRWRVEVSPTTPRANDVFLHVLEVGDQTLAAMAETKLVRDGDRVGVAVGSWQVLFDTSGPLGGHIRHAGDNPIDAELTRQVLDQTGITSPPPGQTGLPRELRLAPSEK
jgi:heparin/heparan-sulfate lyase